MITTPTRAVSVFGAWLCSIVALTALRPVRADMPLAEAPPALPQEEPAPIALPTIELRQDAIGAWRFFVDGEVLPLRGVGGAVAPGLLEAVKEAGGNCVRTWGAQTLSQTFDDGETFLDRAHRLGIKVLAGLWVEHERHLFDYSDPEFIQRQRDRIRASVQEFRGHRAILAWGLGNEMEGPADREGSLAVWKELEELARIVKAEDPTRPILTAIAFHPAKIPMLKEHCPSIDLLGINAYGGAGGAGALIKAAGWTKPFAVTEFGVDGFWETPQTSWGAPYEPDSQQKARSYYAAHKLVFEMGEGRELCVGTFAFLWGWKQERTSTWFGMFLPTLERLPQVDAMTFAWTGHWPRNRCPRIESLTSDVRGAVVQPGTSLRAVVEVKDPEGDNLAFAWEVAAESQAVSQGGDAEEAPPSFPDAIVQNGASECLFTAPGEPGHYRLYLIVRDGQGGAATANLPFRVER